MDKDTTIGMLCLDYDCTVLASVLDLKYELDHARTVYTAKQYCDGRCSTNLTRFVYDPFTGEKIDWKKIKELLG